MTLFVFPNLLNLYSGTAITSLTYFVTGIGIWLTGVVSKGNEFKIGALCLFAGSALAALYDSQSIQMILFLFIMTSGFVIPGIVSKYNEGK